ncbi:MAG TPA: hypothetical protein VN819_01725, partial [Thermoplasmata archaeon]|nr:hypothetical protein [Thermoplasmata archaeon]
MAPVGADYIGAPHFAQNCALATFGDPHDEQNRWGLPGCSGGEEGTVHGREPTVPGCPYMGWETIGGVQVAPRIPPISAR